MGQHVLHKVILTRLAEYHPIHRERLPQCRQSFEIATHGEGRHMSLDLGSAFSWIDPEGDQIRGAIRSIVDCASEQRLPRIGIVGSFWNPILLREVLAHGM